MSISFEEQNLVTSATGRASHRGNVPFEASVRGALFVLFLVLVLGGCTSEIGTGSVVIDDDSEATSSQSDADVVDAIDAPSSVRPAGAGLAIEVTRVSDGDSIRATSSEGNLEIRLIGINAPEQDECFGAGAKTVLEELVTSGDVSLHPWPAEIDDFGRELGFLVVDDVFVNLRLVESGAAVARAQADHEFAEQFETAERAASDAQVGLWAPDACGAPVAANVAIVDVLADAPGNDQQNPNGEWVLIENQGTSPVDLTDWSLRDESTRHRYTFPEVQLAPGQQARIRTGCGQDDRSGDPAELFWCDPEPPVWNNSGDTAFLLDPNGAIVDNVVTE